MSSKCRIGNESSERATQLSKADRIARVPPDCDEKPEIEPHRGWVATERPNSPSTLSGCVKFLKEKDPPG